MPRVPKATDSTSPKKRVSKPKAEAADGTKVDGTKVVKRTELASESALTPETPNEEQIRIRAYEIYLRRGGRGGSPEQDWFQAVAEVHSQSIG